MTNSLTAFFPLFTNLGVTKGSKLHISKAKTCRSVPEGMLDSSDFECSLCMR